MARDYPFEKKKEAELIPVNFNNKLNCFMPLLQINVLFKERSW